MSYADQVFVAMCKDIIENGTSTEGLVPTNYAEAYAVAVYTLIQNEKTINNNIKIHIV